MGSRAEGLQARTDRVSGLNKKSNWTKLYIWNLHSTAKKTTHMRSKFELEKQEQLLTLEECAVQHKPKDTNRNTSCWMLCLPCSRYGLEA